MPRESAAAKATRLLLEGRVSVVRVDRSGVLAVVKGDSGYLRRVQHVGARWTCDCPAIGPCSHAQAVARVVVVPGSWMPMTEALPSFADAGPDVRGRRLAEMAADPPNGRAPR